MDSEILFEIHCYLFNILWKWSCSVVSDSLRPHGLQPTRVLRLWDFQARVLDWGAIAFSDHFARHIQNEPDHEEVANLNWGIFYECNALCSFRIMRDKEKLRNKGKHRNISAKYNAWSLTQFGLRGKSHIEIRWWMKFRYRLSVS